MKTTPAALATAAASTLAAAAAPAASTGKRVRFRLAGYVFTYRRADAEARVRIEMWREDPATGERHWITVAACAPNRASARSVALALVAWVRACDVGPERRDARAQAVAESFALLRERLALMAPGARGEVHARRAPSAPTARAANDDATVAARDPLAMARAAAAALTPPGASDGTRDAAA